MESLLPKAPSPHHLFAPLLDLCPVVQTALSSIMQTLVPRAPFTFTSGGSNFMWAFNSARSDLGGSASLAIDGSRKLASTDTRGTFMAFATVSGRGERVRRLYNFRLRSTKSVTNCLACELTAKAARPCTANLASHVRVNLTPPTVLLHSLVLAPEKVCPDVTHSRLSFLTQDTQ